MTQGASKTVPEKAPPSAEGGVMVLGLGPSDVLLDSPDASAVIVRGRDGEPSAILARLRKDIWGFSKRGDDDWDEVVSIYCGSVGDNRNKAHEAHGATNKNRRTP